MGLFNLHSRQEVVKFQFDKAYDNFESAGASKWALYYVMIKAGSSFVHPTTDI